MEHAVANTKHAEAGKDIGARQKSGATPEPGLHPGLQMQQLAGNQAMQELFRGGLIQGKLSISQPGDAEEQEADATATRILRSHAGADAAASTSCSCGDDEEEMCDECRQKSQIARKASDAGRPRPSQAALGHIARSAGHPLDAVSRSFFEPRFGRDFSRVRVHTDSHAEQSASALRAHAYVLGSDIYFGAGKYAPGSDSGRRLLAHEIAHTVQQEQNGAPDNGSLARRQSVTVGRVDDPLEAEADRVADRVMDSSGSSRAPVSADRAHAIRGAWYDDAWDTVSSAGEWVGEKVEAGGEAAVAGAKWVGNKVEQGADWVGNKAEQGAKWVGEKAEDAGEWALGKFANAWGCVKSLGRGAANLATGDVHSLTDLLGIPAPEGADPSTLDTIVSVLKHPCLQMIPGYGLVSGAVGVLEKVRGFLAGAWRLIQNPQPIIDGIQSAIGKMIATIPAAVQSLVEKALQAVGSKAKELGEGIWRHLEPKLAYLAKNWWDVIKQTGWTLLWPWPTVGKDLGECWDHLKSAGHNLWNLNFSKALDDILAVERSVNSILGSLYGWFFIASVLVGAIIGAFFGGAGAIPGALAGAAFAGEVGEALLVATVAVESASVLKSIYNLLAQTETPAEKEKDYEQIASSSLTLAITGVMMVLGALAAKFAKGLLSRVAGLFRRAGSTETEAVATGLSKGAKGEVPDVGPNAEPTAAAPDAEAIKAQDLPKLEQEIRTPNKVRPPEDPAIAAKYDAEVEVGDHIYRRNKTNGTWCRFSDPVCGIEIPEVGPEVDEALAAQSKAGGKAPKAPLSDEAIDLAIERLQERHNIDPAKIPELREYIRAHPEELDNIAELMRDTPDVWEPAENTPGPDQTRGGSKPGELGKVGKDLSRAAARDVFHETFITEEAEFTVTTADGRKVTFRADIGTLGPGGEPTLVEAKFGSGAGLEQPQEIGYPLISSEGGVPNNAAAKEFAQKAFPGWKPGDPIPPTRVRIDYWSGTTRRSMWLPAGK